MTVTSTDRLKTQPGEILQGVTVTIPYLWLLETDLSVVVTNTATNALVETWVLDTDFTTTGARTTTGSISTLTLVAAGNTLNIIRITASTQPEEFVENDNFASSKHQDQMDRATLIIQEVSDDLSRAMAISSSVASTINQLITPILPDTQPEGFGIIWNAGETFDNTSYNLKTVADAGASSSTDQSAAAAAASATAASEAAAAAENAAAVVAPFEVTFLPVKNSHPARATKHTIKTKNFFMVYLSLN